MKSNGFERAGCCERWSPQDRDWAETWILRICAKPALRSGTKRSPGTGNTRASTGGDSCKESATRSLTRSTITPPLDDLRMVRNLCADFTCQERELYSSPNGDSWYLVREPETGRLFVRHKANVNLAAPARTARKIHSGEGGVLNRATPLPISGGWDTGAPLTTKSILRSGLLERAVHSTNQAAGGFSQHGGDNGLATGLTVRIPFHARRVSPRSDFPSCACIDEAHLRTDRQDGSRIGCDVTCRRRHPFTRAPPHEPNPLRPGTMLSPSGTEG